MRKTRLTPSVLISLVLAILLLASLILLAFFLPRLVDALCQARAALSPERPAPSQAEQAILLCLAYGMELVAAAAILLLCHLLRIVAQGDVFSVRTARTLLAVSLCCFGEGLLFLGTAISFHASLAAAAALSFVGLCLLIVRNVIAQASLIKAENDYTI